MRAYRKRKWTSIAVNMTPLIDVVFLIIIFFIMIMNVSDVLSSKVTLPLADEAKKSKGLDELSIIIKTEKHFFIGASKFRIHDLKEILQERYPDPKNHTVQLRADEDVPYETVRRIMQEVAAAGITRINFSTRIEEFGEEPQKGLESKVETK